MPLDGDLYSIAPDSPASGGLAATTNNTTIQPVDLKGSYLFTPASTTSNDTVQDKVNNLQDSIQQKVAILAGKGIKTTEDKGVQATYAEHPERVNYMTPAQLQEELGAAATYQILTNPDGSKYQFRHNADGTYAHDANGEWIKDPVQGSNSRNAYIDMTNEGNYKFGLARNDVDPSVISPWTGKSITPFEARYSDQRHINPYLDKRYEPKEGEIDPVTGGPAKGYNGTPGSRGVTPVNGSLMDITLPKALADKLEYDIHTNAGQLASRAMGQGPKTDITTAQFGAGQSEYTTPDAPLWNSNYDISKANIAGNTVLPKEVKVSGYQTQSLNTPQGMSTDNTQVDTSVPIRSWGDAAKDTGKQTAVGVLNAIKNLADIYGVASGNHDNWVSHAADVMAKGYSDSYSPALKAAAQHKGSEVAKGKDELEKFWIATKENFKNPMLISQLVVESVPMMAVALAGGEAMAAAKLGIGATEGMLVAGAVQQGADMGQSVIDSFFDPQKVTQKDWDNNPKYQEYIKQGMDPLAAKNKIAVDTGRVVALASGLLSYGVNKFMPGGHSIESKLTGGKVGGLVKSTAGESATEVVEEGGGQIFQNIGQQQVTPGLGTFANVGQVSADAMAAGGATNVAIQGPGALASGIPLPKQKSSSSNDKEETVSELTPEEKNSIAEFATNLAEGKVDFKADPTGVMNEIYKHEELLTRAKEGEGKRAAQAELAKAKAQIGGILDSMDEENPLTFGSRKDAENFIGYAIENSVDDKGKLAEEVDRKLSKIANKAGLDEKAYKRIKDSYTVQLEAEEGRRGYSTYAREIQTLLADESADPKILAKKVRSATDYLASQERYVTELEAGIERANDLINAANKPGGVLTSKQVKIEVDQKVGTSKWTINIDQDADGKYKINQATMDLLEAKKGNVAGIREALKGTSKELKAKGIDVAEEGFRIPIAESDKHEELRKADRSYYESRGVNKVILGDKTTKKWKYYKTGNESIINTGEYSKDDVVLVNTTSLEDYKDSKGKIRKLLPKDIQAEIKKAVSARAKIVLDRDMLPVRGNDQASQKAYGAVRKLLTRYVGGENVYANPISEETGKRQTGTFILKSEVEKINADAKKKFEETKKQQKVIKEAEANIDALVTDKLVNDTAVKVKAKDFEVLKDKYEAEDNKEIISKIVRAAQTRVRAKINAAINEMSKNTAFSIVDEDTYMYTNEVMKIIGDDDNMFKLLEKTMDIKRTIAKDVNGKLNRLKMLKAEALETGDTTELEEFYAENSESNEGKRILEDSYSKGAEDLYLYKTKEDGKVTKTINKESIPNKVVWQTAIPRDINKITKVGNVTALNLAPLDELGSKELETITDTAVKALKEVVGSLKDEKAAGQNSLYWLYDSPARGLLFDKDGNVNKTTAAAMVLGLGELLQNNGYMMTDGYKSADDLANMLGLDNAFGISKEVRELIGDKGMLHTTAIDSLSKAIVAQLGLVSGVSKEYDAQAFDALRADLASMALLIGMNKNVGMLELTKVPQRQYVKTVLDVKDVSNINENAMVNFVRAKTTVDADGKKVYIKSTQHLLDNYKIISEQMPLETSLRKEPSLHPLSKGEIKAAVKSVRKDLADMNIPKEAVQALEGLMHQEWIADVELVKEAVEIVKEHPNVVGYVKEDSKEFRDMMYDERDSQVAVNRDIDKAISELDKLVDGKDADIPLWFKWFYTKNQRYMLDANTVNPQTGKQLERFLIYPKSFKKELKVVKGDKGYKFERDGKDVTLEIKASIAQGMGFGIDKKHSDKAIQVVDNLLKMSPEMFNRFKQQLLVDKKVEGTTNFEVYKKDSKGKVTEIPEDAVEVHAEIEHFGHALQALKVIEAVVNKQRIKSPLSAEYDAVTSGFGIKGFQFPLNTAEKGKEADYKHLERVGFFIRKGDKFGPESTFGDKEILTPEVFGDKVINDSYEGLGLGMPSKEEFTNNRNKYFSTTIEQKGDNKFVKTMITRNMTDARWAKIVEVIPSKDADGSITKALRTIFKYPFMTFNYASALKSVRKLLANSLTESMLKDMYYAEDGDKKWNDFAEVVVGAMRLEYKGDKARQYLKELLNDKSASNIKIEIGNTNLFEFVSTIVNMSVGEEAEGIFKKEFGDYIYTQKVVTNAFTAVAEVFMMEYEAKLKELRSKGPVTKEGLKEVLASLKDKFPAVAGPLSGALEDNDGIAIIDSTKVTPGDSAYKGRDEAQTKFAKDAGKLLGTGDQQAINAHYKIKKFAAAISAGAVVPIHAIDGAMMAKLINWCKENGIDIVAIHDAIIVAPEHTLKVTQKYNELMYEVNKNYNLLGELKSLVDRTLGNLDMNDAKYKREIKVAMLDENRKDFKVGSHTLKDFISEVRSNLDKTVKENNKAREELFATIEKYGASSNHMASLPGGSYQIKASGEIEAGVKAKDSKIAQELNVSTKEVDKVKNEMFKNCKGS